MNLFPPLAYERNQSQPPVKKTVHGDVGPLKFIFQEQECCFIDGGGMILTVSISKVLPHVVKGLLCAHTQCVMRIAFSAHLKECKEKKTFHPTWTLNVCKIMVLRAIFMGLGPLFYIPLRSR